MIVSTILRIAPIVIAVSIMFIGCQNSNEKISEAQQDVATAKENLHDEKNKAEVERIRKENATAFEMLKNNADAKIQNNEILISKLHNRIKRNTNRENVAYHNSINTLEQQNIELRERMKSFNSENNDWQTFQREFLADMQKLETSIADWQKK